ncbi:hypothetical protein ILUMI_22049 [Ignelater luminosus]|uniref:Uncharacterized protein n=1 Tax=Ignelater luminosus TaxID=2038154 RepID=A0A8K0G360_IGNLU|nr:hypothetical protein ILUMI_22049 [Ignelater luminosus]
MYRQSTTIADIIRDLLTRADSIEKAAYICENISNVSKFACFELRKWYSNKPSVLKNVCSTNRDYHNIRIWRILERQNKGKDYKTNGAVTNSSSIRSVRFVKSLRDYCKNHAAEIMVGTIGQSTTIADIIRDLLTRADSIEKAAYICENVSNVLKSACFELRKWYSNKPSVLENVCSTNRDYYNIRIWRI